MFPLNLFAVYTYIRVCSYNGSFCAEGRYFDEAILLGVIFCAVQKEESPSAHLQFLKSGLPATLSCYSAFRDYMKLCWSVKRIFYTYPSKLSSNSSKNVEFGTTVNLVTGHCSIVFSVVS